MIFWRAIELWIRRDESKISHTAAIPRSTKTIPKAELSEAGSADRTFIGVKRSASMPRVALLQTRGTRNLFLVRNAHGVTVAQATTVGRKKRLPLPQHDHGINPGDALRGKPRCGDNCHQSRSAQHLSQGPRRLPASTPAVAPCSELGGQAHRGRYGSQSQGLARQPTGPARRDVWCRRDAWQSVAGELGQQQGVHETERSRVRADADCPRKLATSAKASFFRHIRAVNRRSCIR